MSHTVPTQHPPVVLRSTHQRLRALLAIATIAIVGLTVAVVVLAINNGGSTTASPATRVTSAIRANPSAEIGAKLNHRGLQPSLPRATTSATRVQPSAAVGPNPDQLQPPASVPQPGPTSNYPGHF
jgi:hypothetical protein